MFYSLKSLGDSTFFRLFLQQGFALFAGFRYKYKLADDRPESFEKYQGICQHIDALSDLNQIHEKLRPVKFKGEIDLFVKKCQEELKLV